MSTQRNNPIAKAIRFALIGGAAAAAISPVFAADEAAEEETRIEVTGSRIKRTDVETVSPVLTIDRASIEASGLSSMGEIIQRAPIIAGAGTNPQVNNGGGDGASSVDLRGLGSDRTLILVDGRRFLSGDVNQIPINIVERVEILKDGASSVYGSDAIAGVVNVITRKDFEGVVTNLYMGETSENDGQQTGFDVTAGITSDRGHMIFGASYLQMDEIGAGDRKFSEKDVYLYDGVQYEGGSPTGPWGRFNLPTATATALGFTGCENGGSTTRWLVWNGTGDGSSLANYRCFETGGGNNDLFNYQPDNLIRTPVERKNFFVKGSASLTDNVEYYGDATFNNSTSAYQIAALPQGALTIGADNPYNPFGVQFSSNAIRANGVGLRSTAYDTNTFDITNGIRGTIGDSSWEFDAYYTWSEDRTDAKSGGYIYKPALDAALLSDDPTDAVNLLWLGGLVGPQDATQQAAYDALVANAQPILSSTFFNRQKIFEASVTGDLFEMPAGMVAMAAGYQHLNVMADDMPDFLAISCAVAGEACDDPVAGGYTQDDYYVEFSVPLAEQVELSIGSRMSDYSTFGDTTNSKIGLTYRPIDSVLLRTTWAEVFRAPTIDDLFTGNTPSADTYTDPCNGSTPADSPYFAIACENVPTDGSYQTGFQQLTSIKGGNTELQPEFGETFTFGVVWSPDFIEGFSASLDYYKLELEDTISVVGTQNILDLCFEQGVYCERVHRDSTGDFNEGEGFVEDFVSNLGVLETEGFDFNIRYVLAESAIGRFAVNLEGTYIRKYDKQTLADDPSTVVDNAGYFYESSAGGDGAFPKIKANINLNWSMGDWDAAWNMRYIGSMEEPLAQADGCLANGGGQAECPNAWPNRNGFREIDDYLYHDLQVSYNVAAINTRFSVGMQNATDEQPPLIYTGFNADTDVRTYDTAGRFMYARATVTF